MSKKQRIAKLEAKVALLEARIAVLEARPIALPYVVPQRDLRPTWIRPPEPEGTGSPMPTPYRVWCDTESVSISTREIGWGRFPQ